jgi:hypothetical protein
MAALDSAFFRILDDDGHAVSGGKLRIRNANTSDLSSVYSNAGLSIALTNPVEADSAGFIPPIYIAAGTYDITMLDASDVQIGDVFEDYNVPDIDALDDLDFPVVSKTADFTITNEDSGKVFEVDASAAPGTLITVTAEAGTVGNGVMCIVVNVGASGTVLIQAGVGETFDGGASSYTLDEQNEAAGIVSRGAAGWRVILQPSPTIPPVVPQGRLTLTSATPVLVADVTSATSIYYTPYAGRYIPIYDGTEFTNTAFAELTLALDSNSGHSIYHQSGKNFDLYVVNDDGTVRLGTGAAWTNDTTRAEALTRLQGILVNNASMTLRFGSASGNTITVAASQGTYVGTVRMSADGTTLFVANPAAAAGGGNCRLLLYNHYNRIRTSSMCRDSANSWANTSASWDEANNSTSNRISVLRGSDDEPLDATFTAVASSTSNTILACGIGVDSVAAFSGSPGNLLTQGTAVPSNLHATYSGFPGIGFHYFQALEYGGSNGTFYGDNNAATVTQMALRVAVAM